MIIYLDLDSVLVDFVRGYCSLVNRDHDETVKNWKLGSHRMEDSLDISRGEFYEILNSASEDYWANLEFYHYGLDFYQYCCSKGPTLFLTKPTSEPSCLAGKLKWMHKHFGKDFHNYVITPHKWTCAKPTAILVDDLEHNINLFKEHGGKTILFPALTNSRHQDLGNIELIKKELDDLLI